jgi:hypothetical protein
VNLQSVVDLLMTLDVGLRRNGEEVMRLPIPEDVAWKITGRLLEAGMLADPGREPMGGA